MSAEHSPAVRRETMAVTFEFRPLTPDDFGLLSEWHAQPHVIEVWHDRRSREQVRLRYSEKLAEDFLEMFIIWCDYSPIGFIQAYKARDVGNGWWPDEAETTWGVDLFIGVADRLGKGLGSALLRQFSNALLARPGVEKIIADPAPGNGRSIRAFEKAGFRKRGPVVTPDGDAILLEKTRGGRSEVQSLDAPR